MITDYIFLGSNFIFILLPIAFFGLSRHSIFLQKHLTQPIENDRIFQNNNTRFFIIYRLILFGGIFTAALYFVSIVIINTNILTRPQLTQVSFIYFIFTFSQIVFSCIVIYLILFSLLFYRFKPEQRHLFIQAHAVVVSSFLLTGVLINIFLYYGVVKSQSLPALIVSSLSTLNILKNDLHPLIIVSILLIVSIYCFMYIKFSRKRNRTNARSLLIIYLIAFFAIIYLSINLGSNYFGIFDGGMTKQLLFDLRLGFSGVLWIYLSTLSFFSIFFSVFIFNKKDQFIGSQFAINYTLKLVRINYYSTLCLLTISLVPWISFYYFKYI